MRIVATPLVLGLSFGALALLLTWPLAMCADRCLSGNLGDPLLNAWIVGWGAERLAGGFAGVWDAPIFYPHEDTLAYSEHLLGIAVLVAPIYWLSGNAILAYNAAFIAAYALAAFGMYLLAKQLTTRVDVSFVTALAFACSPYLTTSQTTRLQMLYCGWMAIGLAGLHGYFQTGARARLIMFAAAYVMLGLCNMYLFAFFAIPVALVMAYGALTARRPLRTAVELALAVMVVAAAIAPIAGLYRDVQRDMTLERSTEENIRYSAAIRSYASVWHESPLARWLPSETVADRALFPGLTITGLALLPLWRVLASRRRRAPAAAVNDQANHAAFTVAAAAAAGPRSWWPAYAAAMFVAFALSLGPVPHAGTAPIADAGPYAWLMQMVPGLDGFRAPARFGVIVLLGLGALAAMGLSASLRGRSRGVRALMVAGACVAAVAEGMTAPARLVAFPGTLPPAEQNAFAWLAAEPPGAVLVLPIVPDDFVHAPLAGVTQTLVYQHATLLHDRPIVNGSSGFKPPLVELLESQASPFRDPAHLADGLRMVRALGVRYVVVHEEDFRRETQLRGLTDGLRSHRDQVVAERTFGRIRIFTLRPDEGDVELGSPRPPAAAPIVASRFSVFASDRPEQLDHALEESLWSSGTLQSGREWLSLYFPVATDIAHLRLSLDDDALGDYPRRLQVVSIGEDGHTRTLFEGSPIVPLALSLVRRPVHRGIDIALAENRTTHLLMRQVGRSVSHGWSVHELAVWNR